MAEKKEKTAVAEYTKEQALESKEMKRDRDLLDVLLEDGKRYSLADIKSALQKAKKEMI